MLLHQLIIYDLIPLPVGFRIIYFLYTLAAKNFCKKMGNHISTLILVRGLVKSLLLNICIIVLALDLRRDHKSSLLPANIFLDKDRFNVLKTSSRKHFLTPKSYLKYVFLKTSCWRCLSSMSCRCLKNNLKTSSE